MKIEKYKELIDNQKLLSDQERLIEQASFDSDVTIDEFVNLRVQYPYRARTLRDDFEDLIS